MMIAGPTGAGKSVLLALIALQFRRYRDSQIYIFDKGLSARASVLAMGGTHHALGLGAAQGERGGEGSIAFSRFATSTGLMKGHGPQNGSARWWRRKPSCSPPKSRT